MHQDRFSHLLAFLALCTVTGCCTTSHAHSLAPGGRAKRSSSPSPSTSARVRAAAGGPSGRSRYRYGGKGENGVRYTCRSRCLHPGSPCSGPYFSSLASRLPVLVPLRRCRERPGNPYDPRIRRSSTSGAGISPTPSSPIVAGRGPRFGCVLRGVVCVPSWVQGP